jgi:hypothetical protein
VWSRVSEAYRAGGEIFLLYWSGLLSECLSRYEDAVEDLAAFLASEESKPLASMVADARARLRRRARGAERVQLSAAAKRVVPTLLPGVGLAAGAAVLGVVAAREWNGLNAQHPVPQAGTDTVGIDRSELETNMAALEAGKRPVDAMVSIAVGMALTSVISFVIAGGANERAKGRSQAARFSLAPGPDGLYLGLSTTW